MAAAAAQIPDLGADFTAFQLDAVLMAANTAMRFGDEKAADIVRRLADGLPTPA